MKKLLPLISIIAAFPIFFIGLTVIILPGFYIYLHIHPIINWTLIAVCSLILVAILFYSGRLTKPPLSILFPIFAALITLPIMTVAAMFYKFDLIAVIHHINFGMPGTEFGIVLDKVLPLSIILSLFIFAIYTLIKVFDAADMYFWYFGVIILLINPLTVSMMSFIFLDRSGHDLENRIIIPEFLSTQQQPDVIVLYLEGIDRSFASNNIFHESYNDLQDIGDNGITFTGIRQIEATGWSAAGFVATQCGLPLVPNGIRQQSNFQSQNNFLREHICLTDHLSGLGYQTSFFISGDEAFGGINHFLNSHSYQDIIGKSRIAALVDADLADQATARARFDDQLLLDVALDHYAQYLQNGAPIFLALETYGPHGYTGSLSRNCTDSGRAERSRELRETIPCTVDNVIRFIDRLQSLRQDRPTLLVLASDHLNHGDDTFQPNGGDTTNTVMMVGFDLPSVPKGVVNDREGSMLDVYPTMLALLGMLDKNGRAGLGVSLLGDVPTLVEEKGFDSLNGELRWNLDLRTAIWGPNKVVEGPVEP